MHFYLKYKGNEISGSGLPVWLETTFPMVDENPGLDKKILTGDNEALRLIENQDIIFNESNIHFDFFDQYKGIRIVSDDFLNTLQDLKIDHSFSKLNAFIVGSKKKLAKITHKSYFAFSACTELASIDLQTSEYRLDRDDDGNIIFLDQGKKEPRLKYLYRLLVDDQKTSGYDLFRPSELPATFVASERLLIKARQFDLKGLDFIPTVDIDLMDFPGYRTPKRIIDKIDNTL
jgi:hypothetical protein